MSTAPGSEILINEVESKRVVTLNRPRALNALNLSMIRKFYSSLKVVLNNILDVFEPVSLPKWNNEGSVSLILLKGNGGKAFCAGGDVIAVTNSATAKDKLSTVHKDFFHDEYLLNHLIGVCSIPFVSIIDGITMGGGCGLSMHGAFQVATEKTVVAMPETALGLFPDVGGSYFLSRLKNKLGVFMALTGYRLQGADVYHAGLCTHYVKSSVLPTLENELMEIKDEEVKPQVIRAKLEKYSENDLPKFTLASHLEEIKTIFGASTMESIIENLRKSNTEFAQKQLRTLSKKSPTSLKVTLKQILEGEKMTFDDVFTMEYRLSQRFTSGHDFHEGCRAILIEKDHKPNWVPAKLEDVTDEMINKYFEPLGKEDLMINTKTHS
uniref:3-hydroxyisobutyryl-CoA hydrolase, mitochondrial n=1 Tax=Syphacia muris TaxID=451379 RepID=A0A0N5A866_9BILA